MDTTDMAMDRTTAMVTTVMATTVTGKEAINGIMEDGTTEDGTTEDGTVEGSAQALVENESELSAKNLEDKHTFLSITFHFNVVSTLNLTNCRI